MADATKAMQQLHGLDIGGTTISVKIAAIAATDMAGLAGLNLPTLDDDEGALLANCCTSTNECLCVTFSDYA